MAAFYLSILDPIIKTVELVWYTIIINNILFQKLSTSIIKFI